MSDRCQHCSASNDRETCEKLGCSIQDSRYVLELKLERETLKYIIKSIMNALPEEHEWLNPELERMARDVNIEPQGVRAERDGAAV